MTRRDAAIVLMMLLGAAGLTICGCGGGGGGGGVQQATVTGTVRDDAGLQPVNNARVEANGDVAFTNAAGEFTLQTTAGNKDLEITKTGYQDLTLSRNLVVGDNSIGTRYLQPELQAGHGAATGKVRRNGVGVGGVVVHGDTQATTKADGSYAIYNLTAGERGLLAVDPATQAVGFTSVNITAGQTTGGADIDLNLEPPAEPVF